MNRFHLMMDEDSIDLTEQARALVRAAVITSIPRIVFSQAIFIGFR